MLSPRAPARVLPAHRRGILLFHSQDETRSPSWQSGVYYADGTPKSSFWAVRDACGGRGAARSPGATGWRSRSPRRGRLPAPGVQAWVAQRSGSRCTLDCVWHPRALPPPTACGTARVHGYGRGAGDPRRVPFGKRNSGRQPVKVSRLTLHPPGAIRERPSRYARHRAPPETRWLRSTFDAWRRLRAHRGHARRAVRRVLVLRGRPAWRRLPVDERAARKEAFAGVVDESQGRIEGLRAYSTVGVRPEARSSSSGRSPSATTISSSSARPSTARRSPAGFRRPTRTSGRPSRRSTPTRSGSAGRGRAAERAVPDRLPLREAPSLVLPHHRGAAARRCASTPEWAASS